MPPVVKPEISTSSTLGSSSLSSCAALGKLVDPFKPHFLYLQNRPDPRTQWRGGELGGCRRSPSSGPGRRWAEPRFPSSLLPPRGLLRVRLITGPSVPQHALPPPLLSLPPFFSPVPLSLLLSVSGFREVFPKHVSETRRRKPDRAPRAAPSVRRVGGPRAQSEQRGSGARRPSNARSLKRQ